MFGASNFDRAVQESSRSNHKGEPSLEDAVI